MAETEIGRAGRMTIIEAIHLVAASGKMPELWHPDLGECRILKAGRETIQVIKGTAKYYIKNGDLDLCKIPRFPFSALVEEVQSDPVDNAVTRNWGGGLAKAIDHGDGLGFTSIDFRLSPDHPAIFTIGDTWGIDCHGVHCHLPYFMGLLRDGYAPGIPENLCKFD